MTYRGKIIKLLAYHPQIDFFSAEVAEKVECSTGSASLILNDLSNRHLVKCVERGRMKFYRIEENSLEVKTWKLDHVMKSLMPLVKDVKKHSIKIIFFGSASRGEQAQNSDIDILVVTREKQLVKSLIDKHRIGHDLKPILKTPSEWSEMEISQPDFYHQVNNGIKLHEYVSRV